jgi:hypothetical protein
VDSIEMLSDNVHQDQLLIAAIMNLKPPLLIKSNAPNVSKDLSFLLLTDRLTDISAFLKYLISTDVPKTMNTVLMETMPTLTSNVRLVTQLFIELMPLMSLKYSLI